jgi:hypothetical protein
MMTNMLAASLPDPETIRKTALEVVQRPEFQIRPVHSSRAIFEFIWRILEPIFRFFAKLWDISPVLAWIVVVTLIVVGTLLIAHIVYTFKQAISRRAGLPGRLALATRKTDPVELERLAEDAAVQRDFITAVRLLFRAALLRLAQGERRELRPGTTNREYLRRYGQTVVADPLAQFVEVLDAKWYGHGQCDALDYQICRQAHAAISTSSELMHAHRA